ncbi:TMEM165/GDT1 family protein [Candidatus Bipolaricaulota sp. J31]
MRIVWEAAVTAFWVILLAELGDKTQLAILAMASSKHPPSVLIGAGAALLLSTALAVALGALLHRYLPAGAMRGLHYAAGVAFIALGIWTILRAG